jgi:hypothetical protein
MMKGCDTMEERIGRIGRIDTDFLDPFQFNIQAKNKKIRINPPNPFFHRIIKQYNAKYLKI